MLGQLVRFLKSVLAEFGSIGLMYYIQDGSSSSGESQNSFENVMLLRFIVETAGDILDSLSNNTTPQTGEPSVNVHPTDKSRIDTR